MEEKKKFSRPTVGQVRELESVISSLRDAYDVLSKSNALMEKELMVRSARIDELECELRKMRDEVCYLRSRGFFSRLFNR